VSPLIGGKPEVKTRSGSPPVCISMVVILCQCAGGCQFGFIDRSITLAQKVSL
jgi:hypothetical protein